MPLLHSGHSKVRPAKPSGTGTVEPQMAQVRAGTGPPGGKRKRESLFYRSLRHRSAKGSLLQLFPNTKSTAQHPRTCGLGPRR
jgi:hypothetical protein